MRLAGRRLITALTLTAAAAAGGVLATSAQTAALARKPACSAPAAHRGHRSQACSRSRHAQTTRPHATTRKHTHSGATGAKGAHRGKRHTVKRKATKVTRKTTRKAKRKATARPAKAACEDGSAPTRTGTDSYTCKDGSEPACENGSFPIVAANGSTLLCNSPASKGGGSSPPRVQSEVEEAVCEDGTSPFLQGGAFACDDGSEPYCEEGAYLTVASDGTKLDCTTEEAEG